MANILSIGAGVMGSAITVPAFANGHSINLVGTHLDENIINAIKQSKNHPELGINLKNTNAKQILELEQLDFDTADVIIIGVNSSGVDWFIELLKKYNAENKRFLMLTKGLYIHNQRSIDILPNKIKRNIPYNIDITAVVGPCKALELAQKYLTNICFINQNLNVANELANIFRNDFYIIETLSDYIGGEFCAALKNVFAIMVGCSQTYFSSDIKIYNPESSIFSHCVKELAKIVQLYDGDKNSVYGLPGLGDLHVTSGIGRNGALGKYLGQGRIYSEIMSTDLKDQTVEGAQLILDLNKTLKENFDNGFFKKDELPIFYELIQAISADKKLHIPWDKL